MLHLMSGPTRNNGVLIPWLTPMAAARGPLRHTSLAGSLIAHLLGLLLFITALAVFDQVFWDSEIREEIGYALRNDQATALLAIALYLLVFELLFHLFAWMTTCWGAGVEPYRQSLGRSLCRWYQLTPWLAVLWIGFILAVQGWAAIENWYEERYFDARFGDYYDHNTEPMQLITRDRFNMLLMMGQYASLGIVNLLSLWWILGTTAVHRDKPTWFASCRWPAVCEGCGYALAGLTDEQTCPECGKRVDESKHKKRGNSETPARKLLWHGLFYPSTIGASMVTRRPTKQPLRVLLRALLLTVLAGPMLMVMNNIGERIRNSIGGGYAFNTIEDFGDIIEQIVVYGLTVGIYASLIGSLLLLGAGTLVGTIVRVMGKRNIMPAACSAACYSAALLPVWVLAQGVLIMIITPLSRALRDAGRYDLNDLLPFLVLAFYASVLCYMVFNVARITKAARYANV